MGQNKVRREGETRRRCIRGESRKRRGRESGSSAGVSGVCHENVT